MKKSKIILLGITLFFVAGIASVRADVSEVMIDYLNENIDNIFPFFSMNEVYAASKSAEYITDIRQYAGYSDTSGGKRNIAVYAIPDGETERIVQDKLDVGNLTDFYLSADIYPNELFPNNEGLCFIGFMNQYVEGKTDPDEKLSEVYFEISNTEISFEKQDLNTMASERNWIGDLSESSEMVNLRIIRLANHIFLYVNNEFYDCIEDDLRGPFQLVFGSKTKADGDTADCSFDNIIVRKVAK